MPRRRRASTPTRPPATSPRSLTDAVDPTNAQAGDEVILEPGDYDVSNVLFFGTALDIHGTGAPSDTRIISTATGTFPFWLSSAGLTLSDLELQSEGAQATVLGVAGVAHRVIIRNTNANGVGCYIASITLTDSMCLGSSQGIGGGIWGSDVHLVLRNVAAVADPVTGTGMSISANSTAAIEVDGKGVIASGGVADVATSADGGSASVNVNLDHSNFETVSTVSGGTVTDPTTNFNQTADPEFVDPASGDLRVTPNSPVIDAGATDASSGTTDILGAPRTQGAAADIGPFEYDAIAPDPPVITSPTTGTTLTDTLLAWGTAEPNSTVKILLNGDDAGGSWVDGWGDWSTQIYPPWPLTPGSYELTAFAADDTGNTSAESPPVTLVVPAPPSAAPPGKPPVKLPMLPANPPKVTVVNKPKAKSNKARAKFVFVSNKPGKHKLVITATDKAGNPATPIAIRWKVVKR